MQTYKIVELDLPSSRTGYVYPTKEIEKALQKINPEHTMFASIQKDTSVSCIHLDEITHSVHNLRIEDGWLVADCKELNVPILKALKESGVTDFVFKLVTVGNILDGNIVTDITIPYLRSDIK